MPQPTQAERLDNLERKMAGQDFQCPQFRDEVRVECSALRAETRQLIVESEEDARRPMRVLHENVVARFVLLEEHWNARAPSRRPPSPRGPRKKR